MTTANAILAARAQSIKSLINDFLPDDKRSNDFWGLASCLSYRVADDFELFQKVEKIAHFRAQQPQEFREFLANL